MEQQQVIDNVKQVAVKALPKGSTLYLYGLRAKGNYRNDRELGFASVVG